MRVHLAGFATPNIYVCVILESTFNVWLWEITGNATQVKATATVGVSVAERKVVSQSPKRFLFTSGIP